MCHILQLYTKCSIVITASYEALLGSMKEISSYISMATDYPISSTVGASHISRHMIVTQNCNVI